MPADPHAQSRWSDAQPNAQSPLTGPPENPDKRGVPCPCGSSTNFSDCCQRLLSGRTPAPNAEALMRSRYVAYALALVRYIRDTQTQQAVGLGDLAQLCRSRRFQGLEVLEHETDVKASRGVVEFVAYYSEGAGTELEQHHERSRFQRIDGRWVYDDFVDPQCPAPTEPRQRLHVPPPQRNSPCPCGRGRKYKQCCGKT